jgi:hypothetical protein
VRTKLAGYLERSHLSHRAFAAKAGIRHLHPMVGLWARGKARPGLAPAFAIERATDGEIPASYWMTVEIDVRPKRPRRPVRRGSRRASKPLPNRNV